MQFDPATTLVFICAIVALLGVQCLFFWLREPMSRWLAWFAAAYIVGASATVIYIIPATHDEFLLLGLGNAFRISAFAFLWHGTREFAGRRSEQLVGILAVAVWLALCSCPAFIGSVVLRVVVASIYAAAFCGLSAWELWRNRDEGLPSLMPAVYTYVSFATVWLLRIPLVNVAPFPFGALPLDGVWLAGYSLMIFIHAIFILTLNLSMTRERRELKERRLALSDPLTGLLNRRAYADEAKRVVNWRGGGQQATAVLVLDLDDFKAINDSYGHEAGDLVLQHFAAIARACTRARDLLYRMGGEEFCFVLPSTGLSEARIVAERIRQQIAQTPVSVAGQAIHATVSIGIATTEQTPFNLDVLLAAGDAAVYAAKALGRNRTVVADPAALVRREAVKSAAA